jgi:hypothetical protein
MKFAHCLHVVFVIAKYIEISRGKTFMGGCHFLGSILHGGGKNSNYDSKKDQKLIKN